MYSQKDDFGKLTPEEENFQIYDQDTTAVAVVLYERGDNYFQEISGRLQVVKKYHIKIKILKEAGIQEANIEIPYYRGSKLSEKVEKIKAVTHNGNLRDYLLPDKIYSEDTSERWSQKKFTFSNVKIGSVLEYSYTLVSPFYFNFNGWYFQANIPKVYSEFNAKIPGNFLYNRSLTGFLKLDVNDASIKRDCLHVTGTSKDASCEVLKYAMKNVPAFKEEEDYMLSASNYISKIDFELSELIRFDGTKDQFTKSWKDVDKEFRLDKDIGRQLTKKGFFEKNVPASLLVEGDAITRAKNIYAFVQNHFAWNGKYGIYRNIRVKKAFDERKGNIGEINISLINLLNSAGINAKLMLLSTRQNGLPKKVHPVMSDFNYVIAQVTIDGQAYLLDASDKVSPFGMLPFRCLNHYGRVMDFKNESYWENIIPAGKNKRTVRAQIKFDLENEKVIGVFDETNEGYFAVSKRNSMTNSNEEDYLRRVEEKVGKDCYVTNYTLFEERSTDRMTTERFEYEVEDIVDNEKIYLDPFIIKFFSKNPFTLEERNYPIDFGYTRNYTYNLNIILPEGYEVLELPKKQMFTLEGDRATLKFECGATNNQNIVIFFDLALKNPYYNPDIYSSLKDFFTHIVNIQNKSFIVLKKS